MTFWEKLFGVRQSREEPGSLLSSEHFLLLEKKEAVGARYVMILRESLVESVYTAGSLEQTAATVAGQLFAARSGKEVAKTDVLASGEEIRRKAAVSRFARVSDLVGSLKVPPGWDVPVFSVAWKAC